MSNSEPVEEQASDEKKEPETAESEPSTSATPVIDLYHDGTSTDLPDDCDLCILSDQRIFYLYHPTKESFWEPPRVSWKCQFGLPYGWEEAIDAFGTQYFINHLDKTTTYKDPRQGFSSSDDNSKDLPELEFEMPPQRTYEILRHPEIGFGFVAASQHPVVVQFVTPGGPSDGKLMANDQIIKVNGIDVTVRCKDEVVNIIRSSASPLCLTVAQLPRRKKVNKKRKCRVRFEEQVAITTCDRNPHDTLPSIPNVLRVFLENGQTKSFKYDESTKVQDVLSSLTEKLQVRNPQRFVLASEQLISSRTPKLSLLNPDQLLSKIASSPIAQLTRCRFRITFLPSDLREFSHEDPNAFNYLYEQCVNDVVAGRYACEMRYEACVRMAALHLRQVAVDTNSLKQNGRTSVTQMEREYGLATFLPTILLENVKKKDLKKHLRYYMRKDDEECGQKPPCLHSATSNSCSPMKKCSVSDELPSFSTCFFNNETVDGNTNIRLRYLQIASHLPSFGGRCFSVTFKQTLVDMLMQVDCTQGLLVRHPGKISQPAISIDYELIDYLSVATESDVLRSITVRLRNTVQHGLEFLIDKDDINDLILYISGYCWVIHQREIAVKYNENPASCSVSAPSYHGSHFVYPAGWNYSCEAPLGIEKLANFTFDPPSYTQAIGATTMMHELDKVVTNGENVLAQSATNPALARDACVNTSEQSISSLLPTKSRIHHLTESILHRSQSPRFRDSIRVYKTRHSVPSGAAKCSPKCHRRLSSSSDTDCSQSPIITHRTKENRAKHHHSGETLTEVQRIRPRFLTTNSLSNAAISLHTMSFGLKSPDRFQALTILHTENTQNHETCSKEQIDKLLDLFPDCVCTDPDIIDLTSKSADDIRNVNQDSRKQVRFIFGTDDQTLLNTSVLDTDRPNLKVIRNKDNNGIGSASLVHRNTGFFKKTPVQSSSKPLQAFPLSKTFPMASKDSEFGEDFVPKDYAKAHPDIAKESFQKPHVRRMSLKEFTGLENPYANMSLGMTLVGRLQRCTISGHHGENLLNKFANRRRSSSGLNRSRLCDVCHAFDETVPHSNDAIYKRSFSSGPHRSIAEPLDFKLLEERLESLRKKIVEAMSNLPNESPRRRNTLDSEKTEMMDALSNLAYRCKNMVRATTQLDMSEEEWRGIVLDAVDSAAEVSHITEQVIKKSNSVYEAQLLKSKVDQMLQALIDTVHDCEKAHAASQPYGKDANRLIKNSTTLAATLNQLLQSVQTI